MKAPISIFFLLKILLFGSLTAFGFGPGKALAQDGYYTITGVVKDINTGKPLPYAGIDVEGTKVGTVCNADGEFTLKIRNHTGSARVAVSLLGYRSNNFDITARNINDTVILLSSSEILIEHIIVPQIPAVEIVKKAIDNIGDNYSSRNMLLTGFYRETVRKRNNYIDISEAVINVHRAPYPMDATHDRIQIVKGRRIISPRKADTLAVKLQGGPNAYSYCDVVKNDYILFDEDILQLYRFETDIPAVIDDKVHHVINFRPGFIFPDDVLYHGRLYIDKEDYTISRIEYSYDMSDREKVTRTVLKKKPNSLRFTPHEVSCYLSYKKRDGKSYLNYIHNEIKFSCDWKRRLFSTNYSIVSEMVITDGEENSEEPIRYRESFMLNHSIADKVVDFYDEDFWEDYNIIVPTESLENAVGRLRRLNN